MEIPINYGAVFVSALAAIVIGSLWYGPLFGKAWMHMAGIKKEGMKLTAVQAIAGGFITSFLMAYVLAHSLVFASAYTETFGVAAGVMVGFWNWLGLAVPLTAGVFLWEGKSWKLWALNAGYYFVTLLVMGVILASWV